MATDQELAAFALNSYRPSGGNEIRPTGWNWDKTIGADSLFGGAGNDTLFGDFGDADGSANGYNYLTNLRPGAQAVPLAFSMRTARIRVRQECAPRRANFRAIYAEMLRTYGPVSTPSGGKLPTTHTVFFGSME